jgi:acetyl-CoA carboxylase, biotin carboxylase subunit
MNTRLQVEHPVTEEVWGVDLAAEMIRIALGEPLSIEPARLFPRGHAIECRVYAEDPRRGFAPSPGRIEALRLPEGPGIRNDVGVESGAVIPIDYDSLLGKLIVHAPDRSAAIARLARALSEYEVTGVETTLPLFRKLVSDPEFLDARFDVQWLDRRLADGLLSDSEATSDDAALAALTLAAQASRTQDGESPAPASLWRSTARREGLRGSSS